MASDAIVVGEEWISEHYFTTDATKESFKARVLERRKQWDAEKEAGTARTRLTAARSALLDRFSTLDSTDPVAARTLHDDLRAILGYDAAGLIGKVEGPVTFLHMTGFDRPMVALVDAGPAESVEGLLAKDVDNLVEPFELDETTKIGNGARLLSRLFVDDRFKPDFAVVFAGAHVLVAERERWPEGRYLALDLQLVCERNDDKRGGEVDRALTCLSAESVTPDAQGEIWWHATLAESVKHTVGVSKDLREGVRLSIELIANEVVRRRKTRGLEPLPADAAQPLAKQALRFLYRILFLLYAEASPELGVLPAGAEEYDRGYSLDRLRELILVELPTQRAQAGTHLYESLAVLFRMVDKGHDPRADIDETSGVHDGLTFRPLRADLFRPQATSYIDEVGLGNGALQQVLVHLLLSKKQRGKDRGFISYAELGINQLGAVYEGLMSYTGFFATEDLFEVAKDGNAEKGSWVVPVTRADGIAPKDFVTCEDPETGETRPVVHEAGSFVFRLAGRERQQSASYYTPEVLTRFVVSQALEELLDQDGHTTTSEEILGLTICEPALGSGAFAIEAVRQLADGYLTRRQAELDQRIEPDKYPRELQKVKAWLALHQVHGVDLNATAVELAEISLWLDTMVEGLDAPWFGLHLRRGNSLIGGRKAVFTRGRVEDKAWLKAVPEKVGPGDAIEGRIPHFLLPADGWGAAADVGKDVKELVPDAVKRLKDWRKTTKGKPTKKRVDQLVELGHRVERLWEIATRRLEIAEQQVRRDIPLWGRDSQPAIDSTRVSREQIEKSLSDPDGAYRRLRRVMDAWCALWFWPLTEDPDEGGVKPPTLDEWYDALAQLLGRNTLSRSEAKKGDGTLESVQTWAELGDLEFNDRVYAGAKPVAEVLHAHPWLAVCERVSEQQGFFHWELDFATVFARGGFDLQLGNPPWVRPIADTDALLAEGDPWWQLAIKPTQAEVTRKQLDTLQVGGIRELVVGGTADVSATSTFVGAAQNYPHLQGLQPDLYRCFMEHVWRQRSPRGVAALIHLESHFTDEHAGRLRAACYRQLRRHWQFINELGLFEIQNQKTFAVNVYGEPLDSPVFLNASHLYHPDTVERSRGHDGSGPESGIKDPDGNWDLRPHAGRIQTIRAETLQAWHNQLETGSTPVRFTRMIYTVNRAAADVLERTAHRERLAGLDLEFCSGWHEKGARTRGYFESDWGVPSSWRDVILQGSHLGVGLPMFKRPNPTMLHNTDWSLADLEAIESDALPITSYKPRGSTSRYDLGYTHWGKEREVPARDHYRVAWRAMAANTGERTLIAAIIPPGAAHVHGVSSLGTPGNAVQLVAVAGTLCTLVSDFLVRAVPKSTIGMGAIERLAFPEYLHPELILRTLRLNCLTDVYADLWDEVVGGMGTIQDRWTGGIDYPGRRGLDAVPRAWTPDVPLRRAADRRQALVEIDAIVGLSLGLTADELCTTYRTQFPVLYGYDRTKYVYDANGREVPNSVLTVWRRKGDTISEGERTATNPSGNTYVYELPFVTLDREADMRRAYAHFERVLAEG